MMILTMIVIHANIERSTQTTRETSTWDSGKETSTRDAEPWCMRLVMCMKDIGTTVFTMERGALLVSTGACTQENGSKVNNRVKGS